MFFDDSRPDRRKRAERQIAPAERLARLSSSPIPPAKSYTLFGRSEILHGWRRLIYDVESYPNYFLVSFKCIDSGKIIYFEDTPGGYFVNGVSIEFKYWSNYLTYILYRCLIIGFNSKSYDLPMTLVAAQGARAPKLNEISNEIIREEMRPFEIERKYQVKSINCNHIDLLPVAPISASLKIYGGRLHCERMQDLPFPVDQELTPEQSYIVRDYNINDLDVTQELYTHLLPHIELREQLGKEYEQDLRSKSDAQIAEAVIVTELKKVGKIEPKLELPLDYTFNYQVPKWLSFQTPQLKQLLEFVTLIPFEIGSGDKPKFPHNLAELGRMFPLVKVVTKEKDGQRSFNLEVKLGKTSYTVALGGLHSNEESVFYRSTAEMLLVDRDVASYYPYIILNNNLFPKHLGPVFLEVYRNLVLRRLALKKLKNPLEAGLKIAINGIFGKMANFYSNVYSPDLLTQVTMTGQLALLMQIEMQELAGFTCISANTDGAVYQVPAARYNHFVDIMTMWEGRTDFVTEETRYQGLYSRDVNNYIAIKELEQGKNRPEIKTKGVYSEKGSAQNSVLSKNPESLICSEAVQEYLAVETPLHETVLRCKDIRKFVSVRTVKGGAEKDGVYLGKAVRWYYAKEEAGTINYAISGNKVPKSEGAKPAMMLPPQLPADLDFDRYIRDAEAILYEVGIYQREKVQRII